MKLFIFTLATNNYNKYLQNQFKTIDLLFPNLDKKDKYYIILSDEKYDINLIKNDIKTIDNIYNVHIFSSQYVLICYQKISYLANTLDYLNIEYDSDDLFLYFDADTYFLNKSNDYWNLLYNDLSNNDLLYTIHFWFYIIKNFYKYDNNKLKQFILDCHSSSYFNIFSGYFDMKDNFELCQACLFGGKIKMLKILENDFDKKLTYDLNICTGLSHLPLAPEEHYLNKFINDNKDNYKIIYNCYYALLNNEELFKVNENLSNNEKILKYFNNAFCVQKYDYSFKGERRFPNIEKKLSIDEFINNYHINKNTSNPFLNKFDKNIVLCLSDNIKEKQNIKNQFNKLNILNDIEIFYTNKKDVKLLPIYEQFNNLELLNNMNKIKQYIDHFVNMYNILKNSYNLGYEHICIYESDIIFNDNKDKVFDVINKIPNDYDIIKFYSDWKDVPEYNYQNDFYKKIDDNNISNNICNLCCALMVAYSRKGMKTIIDYIESHTLNDIYNELNDKYYKVNNNKLKINLPAFDLIFCLLGNQINIYDHNYIICYPS